MALTVAENERLTKVGPGTPVGEVMRRYWWPVWFSDSVDTKPVPVRLLGEDLILFRDGNGKTGLIGRYCPHRGASLELGRVEEDGIRCCYHGWKFNGQGSCLDMPAEPAGSPLISEVKQKAYPTQEAAGFVFAYLGPLPAPKLPRYDLLYRPGFKRTIGAFEEYCNWMQRAENAVDQMHSAALHASVYPEIALQRPTVDWQAEWYGVHAAFEVPGKQIKHSYFLFPSNSRYFGARVNDLPSHIMRFRVPVDDVTTRTFFIRAREARDEPESITNTGLVKRERGVYERVEDGWWGLVSREQDRAAQESQGLIADRTRETLGTSDRGVVMFRKMLTQAIDAVEKGQDPTGVVRQDSNDLIVFDTRKVREGKEMVA
jgi:5,5'-dehydrodivanillate O-demethylase